MQEWSMTPGKSYAMANTPVSLLVFMGEYRFIKQRMVKTGREHPGNWKWETSGTVVDSSASEMTRKTFLLTLSSCNTVLINGFLKSDFASPRISVGGTFYLPSSSPVFYLKVFLRFLHLWFTLVSPVSLAHHHEVNSEQPPWQKWNPRPTPQLPAEPGAHCCSPQPPRRAAVLPQPLGRASPWRDLLGRLRITVPATRTCQTEGWL